MNRALLTAGIVGAIAAIAVFAQGAGQPKLTWSSPDVYAGITSTTTVSRTLTFTSDQPLQNLTLEAVPAIARFVQIQPQSFNQVQPGQPQTVRLLFSAPAGSQFGAFEGVIHARVGNRTLPQTLKTSVTFAVVQLPPDPGEAGKMTIEGIDADRDGVRDDLQRYIVLTYASSAKTRAALIQYTKAQQALLLNTNDRAATLQNARNRDHAGDCLSSIIGNSAGSFQLLLRDELLNTAPRLRAFFRADAQLNGETLAIPPASQMKQYCTFNPDLMEN